MFRVVAVVVLLLVSANARAEGPWLASAGGGPAVQRLTGRYMGEGANFGASARLDVGYRVVDGFALGAHLGLAWLRVEQLRNLGGDPPHDESYVPFEGGVGMQLLPADRVVIAPWAGVVDVDAIRLLAGGVQVGYDVKVRDRDRISAVASFTVAPRAQQYGYQSFAVGVAYRCW